METEVPEGYMENPQGLLAPINTVSEVDILRSDVVMQAIQSAQLMRQELIDFKVSTTDEVNLFLEAAWDTHKVKFGGQKGNLTLLSYDGKYKVTISITDSIQFDEGMLISKQLADEVIQEETDDSSDFVKALIKDAYQADKKGFINKARIFRLLNLKINNEKWLKAMKILRESIFVASSKSYMRFYERTGPENKFQQISLDASSL